MRTDFRRWCLWSLLTVAGPVFAATELPAGMNEQDVPKSRSISPENRARVSELLKQVAALTDKLDDPEKKVVALLELADVQRHADLLPDSGRSVKEAIRISQGFAEASEERRILLGRLAARQAELDDFPGAVATLQLIPVERRDFGRYEVFTVLVDCGKHQQAIELSHGFPGDEWEGYLPLVAYSMASRGELDAAVALRDGMKNPIHRRMALLLMIQARLEVRDIKSARRLTATIELPAHKLRALRDIANAELKMGMSDAARQTYLEAKQLAKSANLPSTMLIVLQAQFGELEEALAAAETVEDPHWIWTEISLWLAGQGRYADAFRTAEKIKNEFGRNHTLEEIAVLQAKAGDIAGGLKTARSLPDAYFRSVALREIAKVRFAKEDRDGAKANLVEAVEAAGAVKAGGGTNVIVLWETAVAQAEMADAEAAAKTFQLALKATESYTKLDYRGSLAREVVQAAAVNALSKEALEWASKLPEPEVRIPALLGIADGLLGRTPED